MRQSQLATTVLHFLATVCFCSPSQPRVLVVFLCDVFVAYLEATEIVFESVVVLLSKNGPQRGGRAMDFREDDFSVCDLLVFFQADAIVSSFGAICSVSKNSSPCVCPSAKVDKYRMLSTSSA